MNDAEVERLRRLRASALRVRAVAGALGNGPASSGDALLNRGRCAAWRVARAVSGRLRAHPSASFHRDAGVGVLVANGLAAANTVLGVKTRAQALLRFEGHLKSLALELADVRALTRATDLSDSLGRSQIELRALLAAVSYEIRGARLPERPLVTAALPVANYGSTPGADWPYLVL